MEKQVHRNNLKYLFIYCIMLSRPSLSALRLLLLPPLSTAYSLKPPFSDAVASVALMLVWIVLLGPKTILIIGTKWGIDAEGTHIHNNINNHISTQTHTGAFADTQWTGALESIQLKGRIFLSIYNACSRQATVEHFVQQKQQHCVIIIIWFVFWGYPTELCAKIYADRKHTLNSKSFCSLKVRRTEMPWIVSWSLRII